MKKAIIVFLFSLIFIACNDPAGRDLKTKIAELQEQNASLTMQLDECKKQKREPVLKNTNKVDLKNNKPLVFE